jgi:hypothetical protein
MSENLLQMGNNIKGNLMEDDNAFETEGKIIYTVAQRSICTD